MWKDTKMSKSNKNQVQNHAQNQINAMTELSLATGYFRLFGIATEQTATGQEKMSVQKIWFVATGNTFACNKRFPCIRCDKDVQSPTAALTHGCHESYETPRTRGPCLCCCVEKVHGD